MVQGKGQNERTISHHRPKIRRDQQIDTIMNTRYRSSWSSSKLVLLYILGAIITKEITLVQGYIARFGQLDQVQCIGLKADLSKIENIKTDDLERIQNPQGNRNFEILSVNRITRADSGLALRDRVRLIERIEGVRIRGSDVVVNFKGCTSGICAREVESLQGKTFREINVTKGYTISRNETEVVQQIAQLFNTSEDGVGPLSLEVYATTDGDHLAYFTDVLVETDDYMRYLNVVIDAHELSVLSLCNLAGEPLLDLKGLQMKREQEQKDDPKERPKDEPEKKPPPEGPKKKPPRYLRNDSPPVSVNGISCGSCADDSKDVTWSETFSSCPINSLYLNDTGKEAKCVIGTTADGQPVMGAGPVPELHWDGTLDCKSATENCQAAIMPTCSDAIADVQYAAIETLKYFQDYLGVMGGLVESPDDPVPIRAKVHYNDRYCNAFYRFSANTVFFGDCDCSFWTPLTSIDIVAHEIAHGVTRHSSALEYQYQSGGMNEAFSDIVGTVVEFLIGDSIDVPDFEIGEMLGNKLRSMENPYETGGGAIASVCEYDSNLGVHLTSGPLNKAYVNAVKACESNGCEDLKGCTTLLGTIFMYANIQSLTSYSTYLDGATATCSIVEEFYAAKSPSTTCSKEYVTTFIKQGWSTVNVALNDSCASRTCCDSACPAVQPALEGPTPSTQSPTMGPTAGLPTISLPTKLPTTLTPTQSPTGRPATTPSPTRQPTTTTPTVLPPTQEGEEDEAESIILRIFQMLQNIFSFFNTSYNRKND